MSKTTIKSDRWAQVYASAATRATTWCPGCGHHPTVKQRHTPRRLHSHRPNRGDVKRCKFCGRSGTRLLALRGDEHACHDRPACHRRTALIGRWIGTRVLRRQDLDGTQWTIRKAADGNQFWTLRVQYRDIVAHMSPFDTPDAAKRHVDDVIASLTAGSLRAYAEARQ